MDRLPKNISRLTPRLKTSLSSTFLSPVQNDVIMILIYRPFVKNLKFSSVTNCEIVESREEILLNLLFFKMAVFPGFSRERHQPLVA